MAKLSLQASIASLFSAWSQLAPDAIFSGMTKEQFLLACQPSTTVRARMGEIDQERKGNMAVRKTADAKTNELYQLVVNAIRGSEAHGNDSALYRELGYKTKSERRSGLIRKKGQPESAAANQG